MGTTYKGIYIPTAGEDNWDVSVNANLTRIADRDELVRKSANESVTSSTTLQNDDHLVYTMTANHTWAFKLVVLGQSAASSALKSNFTIPASASFSYLGFSGPNIVTERRNGGSDFVSAALADPALPIIYDGIVTCGATPGNFQYQWAQNASSATALIVATNSYLLMKLLV
jgi:hypothetical protein